MAEDLELDFSAEEFTNMSTSQRVRLCRLLAVRARKLAELSDAGYAAYYRRIANEWDQLGSEIENQS
jgi:hypothetical protein